MKGLIKGCGIVLIICGCILYGVAGMVQEKTRPAKVYVGYTTNGQFVETNRGEIGGNSNGNQEMNMLKAFGVVAAVSGAVFVIASGFMEGEKNYGDFD